MVACVKKLMGRFQINRLGDLSLSRHSERAEDKQRATTLARGDAERTVRLSNSCLKKNMNASKLYNQPKDLGGSIISCRDKSSTWF